MVLAGQAGSDLGLHANERSAIRTATFAHDPAAHSKAQACKRKHGKQAGKGELLAHKGLVGGAL